MIHRVTIGTWWIPTSSSLGRVSLSALMLPLGLMGICRASLSGQSSVNDLPASLSPPIHRMVVLWLHLFLPGVPLGGCVFACVVSCLDMFVDFSLGSFVDSCVGTFVDSCVLDVGPNLGVAALFDGGHLDRANR